MERLCRDWQLQEFKRRHALAKLRRKLQIEMPEKYKTLWWCKDEAVDMIRSQFVESTNHCVIDGFLGFDAFLQLKNEVVRAKNDGMMNTAGALTFQGRNDAIRADKLGWFDCSTQPYDGTQCYFTNSDSEGTGDSISVKPTSSSSQKDNMKDVTDGWPQLQYLLQRIETMVSELGEPKVAKAATTPADDAIHNTFSRSKTRSKVMVTCYDGRDDDTSKYTRHVDNGNKNGRTITAIYYLNEDWKQAHGGALRLYARATTSNDEEDAAPATLVPPNILGENKLTENIDIDNSSVHATVEPMADRLVLFLSDWRTPHEVLPTHKDRLAVTVWFYDPVEKLAANKRLSAPTPSLAPSVAEHTTGTKLVTNSNDELESELESEKEQIQKAKGKEQEEQRQESIVNPNTVFTDVDSLD
jgi:Rps23 Pro-64 3,4-dihydroxylase Tpa1-like proline 4-hydroxylase